MARRGTDHHGDELPSNGDHHERERTETLKRLKDEELAERASEGVEKERAEESRVEGEEGKKVGEGGVR